MALLDRLLRLFRPAAPRRDRPMLPPRLLIPEMQQPPTWPLFDWDGDELRRALLEFESGEFTLAEEAYQALLRDGRIYDGFRKRGDSIRGFEQLWELDKKAPPKVKAAVARLQKVWGRHCLTKTDLSEVTRRLAAFGFTILSKHYALVGGTMAPVLTPWTHTGIVYDSQKRCFLADTREGVQVEIPLQGDDKFVVISVGGERPWMQGALRPLIKLFFLINHSWDRWGTHNDVQAMALKVLKTPRLIREQAEVQEAASVVEKLRVGDLWLCPEGYMLELLESKHANAYDAFLKLLELAWSIVAIILLGHNLSQEVKAGSLAATKVAVGNVTRDVMVADAEAVEAGLEPVWPEWLLANFAPEDFDALGEPAEYYAPRLCFHTDDETDETADSQNAERNAHALTQYMDAATKARVNVESIGIDWRKTAVKCGAELLIPEEGEELGEVEYDEPPEPPPQVQEGGQPGALMSGTDKRGLLMAAREPESEVDPQRAALFAAQDYVDSLNCPDWEAHATYEAALDGALTFDAQRGAIRQVYADLDPGPYAQRLAEALAVSGLAGYLSVIEDYPVQVQPLLLNARSWRVPGLFGRAVEWFRKKVDAAAEVPVRFDLAERPLKRAPELARAVQLDTAARLMRQVDHAEAAGAAPEDSLRELRQALRDLGLSPGGHPVMESPPVREELQAGLARTRVQVLDLDFYRAAYPFWRYNSVLDERTTAGCRALNGLTMPAGDDRWVGFTPPRHWNCRAHIEAVIHSVGAQAKKTTPNQEYAGEGTFGTLNEEWEPKPGVYPQDLWEIYAAAKGIQSPHIELDGPWWRKDQNAAAR